MKEKFPVVLQETVRWGEMDAFQHLNNVHYFRLFENARIKYFAEAGILVPDLSLGIGPILAETSCKFKAPIKYPAELTVGARVGKVYKSGFIHEYEIRDSATGVLAATGTARIVVFDYRTASIAPVTEGMLTAVSKLEGRPLSVEDR